MDLAAARLGAIVARFSRVPARGTRVVMVYEQYDGEVARPAWVDQRIDDAIGQLLRQDREDERAGMPVAEPVQARFAHLVRTLQIPRERARAACICINGLATPTRRVFLEVVCLIEPVRNLVERGFGKKQEITAELSLALEALQRARVGFQIQNYQRGAGQPLDLYGGYDA